MGLRFFADHCVANAVVTALRDAGHVVLRLRDQMAVVSPDTAVLDKARALDAILVSLNGDFSDIVRFPPQRHEGIIALQVKNHPETTGIIVSRLLGYLAVHPQRDHYRRKLLIVEPHRIRVRE
jgi:predicted nuclease of predicted toxin-antitoxin system